jgi:hypothetical protein
MGIERYDRNNLTSKGIFMKKTLDDGRVFGLPLDNFKLRKLVVSRI